VDAVEGGKEHEDPLRDLRSWSPLGHASAVVLPFELRLVGVSMARVSTSIEEVR
jgi:hypothetical protein